MFRERLLGQRPFVGTVVTITGALTAVFLVPQTATAGFPGGDGRIIYTHWTAANVIEDIHSVRPNGKHVEALTSTPDVSDRDPAWNAAGTKIAFHRGDSDGTIRGIWTMNADGTGLAMVPNTDDGRTVAWSPDGSQLAFVCDDPVGDDTEICTIGSDGSGRAQLTATAGFEDGPAWSPDGSEIAFSRTTAEEDRARLVAINPVTQQERFITPTVVGQWDSSPDWSPDGARLAFDRFVTGSDRGAAIHTIAADGSDLQLVSAPATGADIHHITPAWSPKGKRIAFAVVDDDAAFGHIFTIRPNGHALRQITFGAVTDLDPSWQPVSRRLHADEAPGRSDGASRAVTRANPGRG